MLEIKKEAMRSLETAKNKARLKTENKHTEKLQPTRPRPASFNKNSFT